MQHGYIKIQGLTLKAIVALMKELVTEVTVTFDRNRLEIIGFDAERISIMEAVTVDENCPILETPIRVTVLIQDLYKSIRTTEKNDIVLLTTEGDDPILVSRILSARQDRQSWYKLASYVGGPDVFMFPYSPSPVITVDTLSFQKALREVGHSHDRVMLRYNPEKTSLVIDSLQNSSGGGRASIPATTEFVDAHADLYFSKHLQKFLRIAASPQVQIQFLPQHPAIFSYHRDNFTLRLAISPIDQTDL